MEPAYAYTGLKGHSSNPNQHPLNFPHRDHFAVEMDAFSRAVLDGKPFAVNGEEGLRDLLCIEAIYRSIASGKAEKVIGL